MEERKSHMSTLEQAEARFLTEVADRGGVTITEALRIQLGNPNINFGTDIDALDIIDKFMSLGLVKYEDATGKYVPANGAKHR
jgi:hypothetical protein